MQRDWGFDGEILFPFSFKKEDEFPEIRESTRGPQGNLQKCQYFCTSMYVYLGKVCGVRAFFGGGVVVAAVREQWEILPIREGRRAGWFWWLLRWREGTLVSICLFLPSIGGCGTASHTPSLPLLSLMHCPD